MTRACRLIALVLVCVTATAHADAVTGWRTDWTGRYVGTSPPLQWTGEKNVAWSRPLPGAGNATPVLAAGRVFVTAEPFTLLCVDAGDGAVRWQADCGLLETLLPADAAAMRTRLDDADARFREVQQMQNDQRQLQRRLKRDPDNADLTRQRDDLAARIKEIEDELAPLRDYRPPRTHDSNGYASPTPVTDGRHVYAHFGNGIAAAFDLDGHRLWTRLVQRPQHEWGHSSSPVLTGGTLVILVRDLHGLDPATGEVKWTTPSRQRWGSPAPARIGTTDVVITPNGEIVRTADGHVLARGIGSLEYATPVVQDGIVYFIENTSRAVELPDALPDDGTVTTRTLWTSQIEGDRHYASPIIHDGLIYTISRKENLTVLDAATGAKVYERQVELGGHMPNSAYPSVTLAGPADDPHLFVSSESGTTVVMKPGREYVEVARNKTPGFRASPVFVDSRLYLRSFDALRCITDTRAAARP